MTVSLDTNVLLPAVEVKNPLHDVAKEFLDQLQLRSDVVLSEFMLVELYGLLRNPAVMPSPLTPAAAVDVIESLRNQPRWRVVAIPVPSRQFHDALWAGLADSKLARRRAYDWRLALSLVQHGVDEFATANVRDFQDCGFKRVWNPFEE